MKKLKLHGCSKRIVLEAQIFSAQSDSGQRKPILCGLRSHRLSFVETRSFGSSLMYTFKMGVLIHVGTNGKAEISRYRNSSRVVEPIYSLLGFSFTVLLTRERERVSGVRQFALHLLSRYPVYRAVLHAPLGH